MADLEPEYSVFTTHQITVIRGSTFALYASMFSLSLPWAADSNPGSFKYGLVDRRLWMDSSTDSNPWAGDHCSPFWPSHVLTVDLSNDFVLGAQ